MYRREGTIYVRMWCVVRGRVPTPFVLVQIVAILVIHFSVFGLLCCGVCGSVCYV